MGSVAHQGRVSGCHLVGSISGCTDAESAFRKSVQGLPNRLKRVPDGETGERFMFTMWQFSLFEAVPQILGTFNMNQPISGKDFSPEEVEAGNAQIRNLAMDTKYDDVAIESYATFKRLKDEGVIPKDTKFQVCLPTSASVVVIIYHQFRETAFDVHMKGLFKAMRKLQDEIPHEELSIQIDLACDTAFWEGVYEPSWFDDPKESTLQYILQMISHVDQDVELGIHNCYGKLCIADDSRRIQHTEHLPGDIEHRHWHEPTSLRAVTDRGLSLLARTSHKIDYFHCPVPQSAMDFLPQYFSPLAELYPALQGHGCELNLGLVHFEDLEGTKKRIGEAQKLAPDFGVSTACGMGRTPVEHVKGLMDLMTEVSEPVFPS